MVITGQKIKLLDLAMLFSIVATMAFKSYSLFLMRVQLMCCFIIYAKTLNFRKIKKHIFDYIAWWFLFLQICLLSLFYAGDRTWTFNAIISAAQVAMMGVAVLLYMSDEESCRKVLRFMIVGCLVLIARLLIRVPTRAWGLVRVGNYIGYGNNGAANTLIYVSVFLFCTFRTAETRKEKRISILMIILCALFSLMCGSRKSIFVLTIGIGLQLILSAGSPQRVFRRVVVAGMLTVGLFVLIIRVDFFYRAIGHRIVSLIAAIFQTGSGDASAVDRIEFIKRAYGVFKQHPIRGVGLDNFRFHNYKEYYAHNNYLEIAADLGVFGLAAYYWFPLKLLFQSLKDRRNMLCIMVTSFMVAVLAMDMANVSYQVDSIQLYIAVACGFYSNIRTAADKPQRLVSFMTDLPDFRITLARSERRKQ